MGNKYESTLVNPNSVLAKCPRCGKMHVVPKSNWTGRGLPRIYDPECRQWVEHGGEWPNSNKKYA